jgi:S-adenosylmethionine:tRNA ribosyltransferase-isomerase
MPLTLSDFDYELPPELIAQAPLPQRSASRLLVLEGDRLSDGRFADLPQWLRAGDLLVMNDSRVLHARMLGRKESGGQVEVLVERLLDECEVLAQVRASKSPQPGSRMRLEDAVDVEVLERAGEFYRLRFPGDAAELIECHGRLPLPPYIERQPDAPDETRYQTVYAREKGSAAAPTAGLHFDQELLASLRSLGVESAWLTLHVGAGTFQPVRVNDLSQHRMHTERYVLPQATVDAIAATRSRVITNFHLPKSTLLMLVSAFGGLENLRRAYRHAVAERYRFFSYGDAMFIKGRRTMNFELLATDGAARRGRTGPWPTGSRHAGLHAGRHLRRGEGHGARRR